MGERNQYPPPNDYQGYPQQSPQRNDSQRDDNRAPYPPVPQNQDPNRQGQYPPAPSPYQPPGQWAGQPQGQPYQHPPPPNPHYDPHHQHPHYHYPPPSNQPGQPPMHPDYRLPPVSVYPPYYGPPYQQQQPAPAPRQRTAIACKYCRKRKIRCSGYDSSPDGRCQNCVRFNQQCLFHPVSSQAAFVPASALYGPGGARAPVAGQEGQPGQNGQPQPMLYGAHGQPLGPAGPGGQPQYNYPPPPPSNVQPTHAPPPQHPGYPPYHGYHHHPGYSHGPPPAGVGAGPGPQYDAPPPTATSDRSDRGSLKRGPPDDEEPTTNGANHSPHPNARARHSHHEGRPSGSYDYQNPTSPATSTMSYQSYPQHSYTNGVSNGVTNGVQPGRGNNSPPAGLTPTSMQSLNSPRSANVENRTTPPAQSGSAGSSQNGRNGMTVHEMLGNPSLAHHGREQRIKSDNDMLNKLDGKK